MSTVRSINLFIPQYVCRSMNLFIYISPCVLKLMEKYFPHHFPFMGKIGVSVM